jgi:hypothetical protein
MKTFKDVYLFPFELMDDDFHWVYDKKGNFVFQFEVHDKEKKKKLLAVINGEDNLTNPELSFVHKDGCVTDSKTGVDVILIRGWGNLTSPNGFNLSPEEAANVQDTLADYIVEKLNFRKAEEDKK